MWTVSSCLADAGDDDGQDTFGGGNDSDSGEMSDLEEDDPGNIVSHHMHFNRIMRTFCL